MSPAILLRFLREHRSEWADSSIDAYSAAAVKAGPCGLPLARSGSFGGQVILPLAHTIEHEEASYLVTFMAVLNIRIFVGVKMVGKILGRHYSIMLW